MVVFQGWQVNQNSIFGDGGFRQTPQMDVCPAHCRNPAARQHALESEVPRVEIATRLRSASARCERRVIQERPLRREGTSVSP